jgi:hypothetical protein
LTISTFNKLVQLLSADNCPIVNVFIDWNPLYTDDYQVGGRDNALYKVQDEEEQNPWAKL